MSGDDVQGRMAATSGGGSLRSSRRKGRCRGRSGAAGSGKILASRRSRCAARPGSGAAERRKHGGAEERRGAGWWRRLLGFTAARGWMWGAGEGQGPIIGGVRGFWLASPGGITAGIAGRHGAAVAARGRRRKGTGLPGGPWLSASAGDARPWERRLTRGPRWQGARGLRRAEG